MVRLDSVEDIESGFKPVVETVRNFHGFMLRVIGRKRAIFDGLGAGCREVTVQLDHGGAGLDELIAVDLHFVVALGEQDGRTPTQENGCRHDLAQLSYPLESAPAHKHAAGTLVRPSANKPTRGTTPCKYKPP